MNPASLSKKRARELLGLASKTRVLVVGDLMLDRFLWGNVARISPEAPVPIVELQRESCMPGGAGNVARNLTTLAVETELFGVVGRDHDGAELKSLLREQRIRCEGLLESEVRPTSIKTRVVAHTQQVVRIDRESRETLPEAETSRLWAGIERRLAHSDAVIVCDYGKGVVTQDLLERLKRVCRERGLWLSLDPKPVHRLDLTGLSLITPNRKEALELAGVSDDSRPANPLRDACLISAAESLLAKLRPALLLITLGEHGMLLCQKGQAPVHIPTVAKEVFDVSGAGDTVIATFTLAIAAGASPLEAANFSNCAAGVVVGKVGTAIVTPEEIIDGCAG